MRHTVTEAIEAIARGEIVIVTDDDDRENEGDLICAASLCTPEKMGFIIPPYERHRLRAAAPRGGAPSQSAADGRHERCPIGHGLHSLRRRPAWADDGHFRGAAREYSAGARQRQYGRCGFCPPRPRVSAHRARGRCPDALGAYRGGCRSAALAGLPPVGVICELANDDGSVMAGAQIQAFADTHKLKRISVAQLIAYRQEREKLIERVKMFPVDGPSGPLTGYAYATPYEPVHHFAFVQGEIGDGRNIPGAPAPG